jgi:vanillate/3-O-methylgallate O-demethylase
VSAQRVRAVSLGPQRGAHPWRWVRTPRSSNLLAPYRSNDRGGKKLVDAADSQGDRVKYIDLPLSNYSTWPYDQVRDGDRIVGLSTFSGYSYNERSMLSLAILDVDVEIGAEVVLVWGEEGGGSAKPVVERHVQAEIRAVVSPCPYSEVARTSYAEGWRTKASVGG